MAKKVKTKKQKMLADLRRAAISTNDKRLDLPVYSLPKIHVPQERTSSAKRETSPQTAIAISSYTYLSRDLLKTILLTGFVVAIELIIKFVGKI